MTIFYDLSSQSIITDRPDQTESSSTIPAKSVQIESGILASRREDENIFQNQFQLPAELVRFGISKNIELRFFDQLNCHKELNYPPAFGLSDMEIGVKLQILRKKNINTEIAFLSHLIIPTGSDIFTNGKFGMANKICISHTINEFADLGYNLGYIYPGSSRGEIIYSASFGVDVSKKIRFFAEPYGEFTALTNPVLNFDAGLIYLLHDNLQLDFSCGKGINQKMTFFAVGISWNITKKTKYNS